MRYSLHRYFFTMLFLLACTAASADSLQCKRQDCPAFGGHDALLTLLHQCLLEREQRGLQCPCTALNTNEGMAKGYALVKDCKGESQFLLIPTATITGIEDPLLQAPGTPNYFAAAWQSRSLVDQALGHVLTPEQVSLALNPQHRRSQNQLHIHIDCLAGDVGRALAAQAKNIGPDWQSLAVPLKGHAYRAMRILGSTLTVDPVAVLFADLKQHDGAERAQQEMGQHSLLVTGATFADAPGFVVLDGVESAAEELQDHTCGA